MLLTMKLIQSKLTLLGTVVFTRSFSESASRRVLRPGDTLRLERVFADEDILMYSNVSCDSNPLHFDSEFARDAGFKDRVVQGMLVASLFPRIIASHFPGAVYVSQCLQFKAPVYIGDEVFGEVKATSIREHRKKYIAKFSTKCINADKILVIDGEATAILPILEQALMD
ncbi:hypothetical protein K2173_023673 [Erythroxylum novogranatense]|uniref:MaoC-like domain-containing protein n=1 Tax=Erythroxylum novogranatense TaxID=1862640 RepID=A0AAV8TRR2_9ROSI|nr:hypothetical protein K2173_023673 [Erythroxylum novogranatense]